ncbi:MAG: LysE family translocator [Pseudomonadota bacterium]
MSVFLLFVITTFVVVCSPGPAAISVTSQGAANGYWRAAAGIAGVASANVVYFVLSATGVASLIIASDGLFTLIKWLGVVYLVYLGAGALVGSSGGLSIEPGREAGVRALFTKGFIVEFANPKALLYFAAILPQFLDPSQPVLTQLLIMGATTLALDVAIYSVYAFLGQSIARRGIRGGLMRLLNRAAGSALLFAAFKMTKVAA